MPAPLSHPSVIFTLPTDAPFHGSDARTFFSRLGIPVEMVAASRMNGAGASMVRLTSGEIKCVRLSKQFTPTSEVGQWMLWHEAGHVLDNTRVIFRGSRRYGQYRSSEQAAAFVQLLTVEQRLKISALMPCLVTLRVVRADGTRATYSSVDEVRADASLTPALAGRFSMKIHDATWKARNYKNTPSELFAEAVACMVLRPEFFSESFPGAADFLHGLLKDSATHQIE